MIDPFKFLLHCNRLALRKPDQADLLKEILCEEIDSVAPLVIEVARAEGDPIGRVLQSVLHDNPHPLLCLRLLHMVPKETVAMRELAVELLEQKLSVLAWVSDMEEPDPVVAEVLDGVPRAKLQAEEVFVACKELTGRQTANAHSVADLLVTLAECFADLGQRHKNLGDFAKAFTCLEKGKTVSRLLFDHNAAKYLFIHSLILNALASAHLDFGRLDVALELVKEVGHLNTQVDRMDSPECQDINAEAGYLLSKIKSQTNELGEALTFAESALKDILSFYSTSPERFERRLMLASVNYSTVLRRSGSLQKSAAVADELLGSIRHSVTASADAFLPDYANILLVVSENLGISGQLKHSVEASNESVRLFRELHAFRPVFGIGLCMALTQFSAVSAIAGTSKIAMTAINEAIASVEDLTVSLAEARYRKACALLHRSHLWLQQTESEKAYLDAASAAQDFIACEKDFPLSDAKMAAHAVVMQMESLVAQSRYDSAKELIEQLAVLNQALKWHYPDEHGLHIARSFEVFARVHIGLHNEEEAYHWAFMALSRFDLWAGEKSLFYEGQYASVLMTFSLAALLRGREDLWKEHYEQAQNFFRRFDSEGLQMKPPPPMLTQVS